MSKLEVVGETSVRIEGYLQDGVFIQKNSAIVTIPTSAGFTLEISMHGSQAKEMAELVKRVFNYYYNDTF